MKYIPAASLYVEAHMTNPPKPIGFHVVFEGKTIAVLEYAAVKAAIDQYDSLLGRNT